MERKQFLKTLGSGVIVPLMAGCAKSSDPEPDATSNTNSSTGSCAATNSETEGPFPTKSPSTLVMADIRSDRTGAALTMTISIQNKNNSCAPLQGALVDVWHCDKDGYYSEYGGSGMQSANFTGAHFLRGRQITNVDGNVGFTTIFPGWYSGRSTHVHVHIYDASGKSLLVTQIAFPEGNNSAVALVNAAASKGYTKGMSGYTPNASDNVFLDGVSNELATVTGSIDAGFALTHTIVVSA
jgi:protocatechuate 3,4-dioxygenase beta subunit